MLTKTISVMFIAVAGAADAQTPSLGICYDESQGGGGGSNQQGPRLMGLGLTGCYFTTSSSLSATGKLTLTGNCELCAPGNPPPTITLNGCLYHTADNKLWSCKATADRELCDGVPPGHLLDLLAIEGTYQQNGTPVPSIPGDAGVSGPAKYTLACGKKDKVLTQASAIYKCSHGLFEPDHSTNPDTYWNFVPWTPEFNICVRAARADYCGTGVSHTRPGTRIDFFPTAEPAQASCEAGMCDEGTWNENGAVCVSHPRWQISGDSGNHNNAIGSIYMTDCSLDWSNGCRKSNQGPAMFSTRSKKHWPLNLSVACAPDVKDSHSKHGGSDCALDCTSSTSGACSSSKP